MRNKAIYLIRHGETDYNRRGIVQGSGINAELNEFGKAQADAFYDAYGHIPFDKIYTSELIRTHQSVQRFIDSGIPHESYSGLNEISWGIFEGKAHASLKDDNYNYIVQKWSSGDYKLAFEGGESPLQVRERQLPVIQKILSQTQERTVLVAMHGRAMRIFLTALLEQPLSEMDQYQHNNLCLYKLEYNVATGGISLLQANDITHLLTLHVS